MATIITKLYGGRATCYFSEKTHTYKFYVPNVCEKLFQPSVTGILGMKAKNALVAWAAKESLKVVTRRLAEHQCVYGENTQLTPGHVQEWLVDAAENWREEDKSTTIGSVAHRYAYEELRFRCGVAPQKPKFPIEHDAVLMPNFTPGMLEMANASASQVAKYFDEHDFRPMIMERPLWSPSRGFCGTPDYIGLIDGELTVADYKTSKRIYPEYFGQLSALQEMYEEEFPEQKIMKRVAINIPKDGTALQVEERRRDERHEKDFGLFLACQTIYNWNRANDDFSLGDPVRVLGNIFGDPTFSQTRKLDVKENFPNDRLEKPVATDDCPW